MKEQHKSKLLGNLRYETQEVIKDERKNSEMKTKWEETQEAITRRLCIKKNRRQKIRNYEKSKGMKGFERWWQQILLTM